MFVLLSLCVLTNYFTIKSDFSNPKHNQQYLKIEPQFKLQTKLS